MSYKREAREAAEQTLADLWTGSHPVDPVKIARALGIRVYDARLRSDVSGALVKEPGKDPAIVLNEADHPNRKRFSCAHEIGHFIRRKDDPDQYEYLDLRGPLAAEGRDPDEIFANTFAASLLMPKADVERYAEDGLSEVQMALRFDVSREAMHHRLSDLGLDRAAA